MKPSEFILKGWARGSLAKNDLGESVTPTDTLATSWDIEGSIIAAYPLDKEQQKAAREKIKQAICERPGMLLAFNDVGWMAAELIVEILKEVGE